MEGENEFFLLCAFYSGSMGMLLGSTDRKNYAMDQWLRMVEERICCTKANSKEFLVKNYHCGEAILVRFCCGKV